jgi:hypothetical protein
MNIGSLQWQGRRIYCLSNVSKILTMTQLCVPLHISEGCEKRDNLIWDRMRCDEKTDSLVHAGVIFAESEHQIIT